MHSQFDLPGITTGNSYSKKTPCTHPTPAPCTVCSVTENPYQFLTEQKMYPLFFKIVHLLLFLWHFSCFPRLELMFSSMFT
jgi:hypothetical protein